MAKVEAQRVIATDLARLNVLQEAPGKGYDTVVWLDADFLIFDPENFMLPDEPFAVGRQLWVQRDQQGKLKVFKQIHNAVLLFRQDNSFLNFYIETAERLIRLNHGSMPPQFIGPKLLTALHNLSQFPVMECAGMLSPLVIKDMNRGGGEALRCFIEHSNLPIAGANLCISSRERERVACTEMDMLIGGLLENRLT